MNLWLFGYGSLIWRPDIEFIERRAARIRGWSRRFWQGSHDHRGLPHAPGRVVTLIREAGASCDGMAYLVDRTVADETFSQLDHREKNGYERHSVRLEFHAAGGASADRASADRASADGASADGASADRASTDPENGVVYIAPINNFAYLGPAPIEQIATQIHASVGPSGRNIDYLLELADALRALEADDDHVFELEAAVREIEP